MLYYILPTALHTETPNASTTVGVGVGLDRLDSDVGFGWV